MRVRDDGFQRGPAGRAEQLEARQLQLDRDTRLCRRVDHRAAVREHGPRGALTQPSRAPPAGAATATARPDRDRGRARSATRARRRARASMSAKGRVGSAALHRGLQAAAGGEARYARGGDLDALAGARIDALRAPRSLTWNLPNPDTVTSLPRRSASSTVASTASTAREASAWSTLRGRPPVRPAQTSSHRPPRS